MAPPPGALNRANDHGCLSRVSASTRRELHLSVKGVVVGPTISRVCSLNSKWSDKVESVKFTHYIDCHFPVDYREYDVDLTVIGWTPDGEKIKEKISKKVEITSPLVYYAASPVDMVVTDPDGFTINKESSEISEASYTEIDINGDGDFEDIVYILNHKMGDYIAKVVPDPDAAPTDTYTLKVSSEGETTVLTDIVQISDIPDQPYLIESTDTGINAAPIADAEIEVEYQPKPMNEEPDDTYFIEGNTINGANIIFDATTSYDPEGNPLTYSWSGDVAGSGAIQEAYLPIGEHEVILTVSDGTQTSTDVLSVTIEDTIPPDVSAEFILVDVEEDEGLFEISYSATDICDPNPSVYALILTPQLVDPEVDLS